MKELIKKLKEYVGLLCLGLAIILIFSPAVYSFMNGNLTQMQLLKQLWFVYPIILLLFGIGLFLLKDE